MAGTPMGMGTWAALHTTAAVYRLLDAELELPGATKEAPQVVSGHELAWARARLRRHSSIADLPEE